jgi:phospholipid/cholesterol/gamma-HCH transport system permease protein
MANFNPAMNKPVMDKQSVAVWHTENPTSAKLILSGRLDLYTLDQLWRTIRSQQSKWLNQTSSSQKNLQIDAAKIDFLDGVGVAFLIDVQHAQETADGLCEIVSLGQQYQAQIARFAPFQKLFTRQNQKTETDLITRTGQATAEFFKNSKDLVTFVGQVSAELAWFVRNPRLLRWNDFALVAVEAGVAAMPIVGLVAFLIGVILSFQSAIGLEKFGAITFVGPLVSLGIFRELGPLITAILLAGRSSAAFAAEIGTMTVNNEVDALVTAGLNPLRFLVLPRVIAGILVTPILTIFADVVSVFASGLTMLIYGVPLITFYEGLKNTVSAEDVLSGLVKATVYGLVVASVGCLRGMQTGTGAAAVGNSTTRAVVSSIVMIVVVDGIFAFISFKTGF